MCRILLKLTIIICSLVTSEAYANSYKAALKQYRRGQFRKSITLANKAIKRTSSKSQRAKLYKLNGILLYAWQQENFQKSFEIALKYNPRTSVSKKEVLNPKVVTFFLIK